MSDFVRHFSVKDKKEGNRLILNRLSPPFPVSDMNVHFRSKGTFKMNARKAVLADNPELILRVLQLRFDESLCSTRAFLRRPVSAKPPFFLW